MSGRPRRYGALPLEPATWRERTLNREHPFDIPRLDLFAEAQELDSVDAQEGCTIRDTGRRRRSGSE